MKQYFILISLVIMSCSGTKPIKSVGDHQAVAIMNRITLGKYPQWVLIRSHDIRNPVLLILHGGPGASETALFRKYNSELEKHFTVVYWDQRGAGKSYSKKLDLNTITLKQLISDAKELVAYLKKEFHQEKIFLMGHSWGSRLGLYVINDQPEDFYAYVGVGQELASKEGDSISYEYTLRRAEELKMKKAIRELKTSGPPPYRNGFWGGVRQKHWLLKVGGERYTKRNYVDWVFNIWGSNEYTFGDLFRWSKGSGASYGSMVKDSAFACFDLRKSIPKVKTPVLFLSGDHDYNCPWVLVKQYSEVLEAPYKEFVLFEQSGHSPPFEVPGKFNQVLVEKLEAFMPKN